MAADDLVEIVDRDGRVLEVVERRWMRRQTLRHRCTYVSVVVGPPEQELDAITDRSLVVVHQRADWKDTYPSYWDVAFGGVCNVGEQWEQAARRELAEEAGIEGATLRDLGPAHYEGPDNLVVGQMYVTCWPDQPVCTDGEVAAIEHVALGDLLRWSESVAVCPDSAAVVLPRLLSLGGSVSAEVER